MPDHGAMFQELKYKIKEAVSPYVAILQANDCSSKLLLM